MANSKRQCRYCKEFKAHQTMVKVPLGMFCNWGHAVKHGSDKGKELQRKAAAKQHKADKERVKRKKDWLDDLQALVNQYVRLRDKGDGCISCDKSEGWAGQWHCSHYYSRGHSSSLRYNMHNMHKSCSQCNLHLSGNIEAYTPRLIEKIGQDNYDRLVERKSDIRTYDIEWIKRAIPIARKAIKRQKRRLCL